MKTHQGRSKVEQIFPNQDSRKEAAWRMALSFVFLGLMYVNVAVISNPSLPKAGLPTLPLSGSVQDAFMIFGVVSYCIIVSLIHVIAG